jgi:two-component system, sensor histidine kinase YesM
MLIISIIPLIILTSFTMRIIYSQIYHQIIDTRKVSINWIADSLEVSISNYMNQLYVFEVDKKLKKDILSWAEENGELDYTAQERLKNAFQTAISIDSKINSIELVNLNSGEVFIALRSGTVILEKQNDQQIWSERNPDLQNNLFFMQDNEEIVVIHQMNRFETKEPKALIVIHLKPEALGEFLAKIKTSEDESVVLLNDANQVVQMNLGKEAPSDDKILSLINEMKSSGKGNFIESEGYFSFYNSVRDSKLQVIHIVPNTILMNAMKQTLLMSILIVILTFIVVFFFSILFSRIISRPIIQLSKHMRTVKLDSVSNAGTIHRQDEIGFLQSSFYEMMDRNQKLIAQEYYNEIEKRDAQLRALQAQINPHFMYNTLQVIGGIALEKQAQEIYSITLALSDIMRYSLNFSKELVPLREEMVYLNSYLFIQNQRFGNRLHINYSIPDSLFNILIPKLVIQPIIENCLEHGLASKSGEWNITISAEAINEKDMNITIEDNGVGMTRERLEFIQSELKLGTKKAIRSDSNIGLNNVNSRIGLQYGHLYGVILHSIEGKGTTVHIHIKILREGDH